MRVDDVVHGVSTFLVKQDVGHGSRGYVDGNPVDHLPWEHGEGINFWVGGGSEHDGPHFSGVPISCLRRAADLSDSQKLDVES